jgi:hypothetical protein
MATAFNDRFIKNSNASRTKQSDSAGEISSRNSRSRSRLTAHRDKEHSTVLDQQQARGDNSRSGSHQRFKINKASNRSQFEHRTLRETEDKKRPPISTKANNRSFNNPSSKNSIGKKSEKNLSIHENSRPMHHNITADNIVETNYYSEKGTKKTEKKEDKFSNHDWPEQKNYVDLRKAKLEKVDSEQINIIS